MGTGDFVIVYCPPSAAAAAAAATVVTRHCLTTCNFYENPLL